jgi:argininosuccinate synthase
MQSSDAFVPKYSELGYNGFWFSPERKALQALVTETQRDLTGLARLKLYKGNIVVAGQKSPKSLYNPKIATREGGAPASDQSDATGFIRLNALRLRLRAALRSKGSSD